MRFVYLDSRFTLAASSPRSVALAQLQFTSLAVASSRRDLHPQKRAHAGRTTKRAARAQPEPPPLGAADIPAAPPPPAAPSDDGACDACVRMSDSTVAGAITRLAVARVRGPCSARTVHRVAFSAADLFRSQPLSRRRCGGRAGGAGVCAAEARRVAGRRAQRASYLKLAASCLSAAPTGREASYAARPAIRAPRAPLRSRGQHPPARPTRPPHLRPPDRRILDRQARPTSATDKRDRTTPARALNTAALSGR